MRRRYIAAAAIVLALLPVPWIIGKNALNHRAQSASVERSSLQTECMLAKDPKPCHALMARYPELRSEAYQRLAWMYLLQKDFKNALIEAERAIQADPKAAGAYIVRGELFMAMRDPARSIADLTTAISLDPKDFRPYSSRGVYYTLSGNEEAGIKDMQTALQLNPKHEQTQAFLKQALKRKADREEKAGQGK